MTVYVRGARESIAAIPKRKRGFSPCRSVGELSEEFGIDRRVVGRILVAAGLTAVVKSRSNTSVSSTYYDTGKAREAIRQHITSKAAQKDGVTG
jgi:hypothetical protein